MKQETSNPIRKMKVTSNSNPAHNFLLEYPAPGVTLTKIISDIEKRVGKKIVSITEEPEEETREQMIAEMRRGRGQR